MLLERGQLSERSLTVLAYCVVLMSIFITASQYFSAGAQRTHRWLEVAMLKLSAPPPDLPG